MMATPNCVIRSCLLYEFKLNSKASEASRKICMAFSEDSISKPTAQKWFKRFKSGDFTLEDEARTGRPIGINDDDLCATIELNSSLTCQELSLKYNVSDECIRSHLHKLGKRWKLSKWVPHDLTVSNKLQRFNICTSLLSRHNIESFLDRIVTCDEKWIQYKNIKRKYHWLSPKEPIPQSSKAGLHPEKIMLCIWWTATGIVHKEFKCVGQTITGDIHTTTVCSRKI